MALKISRFFSILISVFAVNRFENDVVKHTLKKKESGLSWVYPGQQGFGSTHRVERVSLGQLPGGFLLRPGPVPCLGQPGPGSTRRAGPGFKTMLGRSSRYLCGTELDGWPWATSTALYCPIHPWNFSGTGEEKRGSQSLMDPRRTRNTMFPCPSPT